MRPLFKTRHARSIFFLADNQLRIALRELRAAHLLVALSTSPFILCVPASARDPATEIVKESSTQSKSFAGSKAGQQREVGHVKFCWCPPGRFRMGSPPDEPERRPGETQVDVTISKGFWIGQNEVTQDEWRRIVGKFPGEFTAGEGEMFPVYTLNFAEAEEFCSKLTETLHASGELPKEWEFRLPTEAQWEYACPGGDNYGNLVR